MRSRIVCPWNTPHVMERVVCATIAIVLLAGCPRFNWHAAEDEAVALRVLADPKKRIVVFAYGLFPVPGYREPQYALISATEVDGRLSDWELRPAVRQGLSTPAWLHLNPHALQFDAVVAPTSGDLFAATVVSQTVRVMRASDYTTPDGAHRFSALWEMSILDAPLNTGLDSVAIRARSAGGLELFYGNDTGVFFAESTPEDPAAFSSFAPLAIGPGYKFTGEPIAVAGVESSRSVIAAATDIHGKSVILLSRRTPVGWSPWLPVHTFAQKTAIGVPVGMTSPGGEPVFAIPYSTGVAMVSGMATARTVESPSGVLAAGFHHDGRIVLVRCGPSGVREAREVGAGKGLWTGWRELDASPCRLGRFAHLVRGADERLLLVVGDEDGLRYLWQAHPNSDWERTK